MVDTLEFIVIQIQIDDPMFDFNGYCLREFLDEKFDIDDFHHVSEDQVIIPIPVKFGKGGAIHDLREAVDSVTDATIYRVAVNVDFANQKITTIHVNY